MPKALCSMTLGLLTLLVLTNSAAYAGNSIEKKHFGTTQDGQSVDQITLTSGSGASVKIITYGAAITNLCVPDKNGKLGDVVLGFDNLKQYENESPYFGCIVGRYGNRIARGLFTIDHENYAVTVNNGPNHLHGGFKGLDKRVWKVETAMTANGPSARFTIVDPDGAEGYPGNVNISVIYSLNGSTKPEVKNVLEIQYHATTDHATPINLTHHSYFNLKDGGKSDVLGHIMQINADTYTPVDDTLIPTGEIAPVKGTPIDFTTAKPIGKDIKAMGGDPVGYDHNLVLRSQDGKTAKAATVYEPDSGRRMEVWTTQPGIQFYTGNFLDGGKGKNGTAYDQHHAFCLETQHYPDAPNHANFPSAILRPGEVYHQITEYRFFVGEEKP